RIRRVIRYPSISLSYNNMETLVLSVARQGIMASLTGGWFYDPRLSKSANLLFMYVWLLLFLTPLIVSLLLNAVSTPSESSLAPDAFIASMLFRNAMVSPNQDTSFFVILSKCFHNLRNSSDPTITLRALKYIASLFNPSLWKPNWLIASKAVSYNRGETAEKSSTSKFVNEFKFTKNAETFEMSVITPDAAVQPSASTDIVSQTEPTGDCHHDQQPGPSNQQNASKLLSSSSQPQITRSYQPQPPNSLNNSSIEPVVSIQSENIGDDDSHKQENEDVSERMQAENKMIYMRRIQSDLISCVFIFILVFSVHVSSIFFVFQPHIQRYSCYATVGWGIVFHYLIPQLRSNLPWMWISQPILRTKEYNLYEVKSPAKLMWFDRTQLWALMIERNILYPIFWLGVISLDASQFRDQFGFGLGTLLFVIVSTKLVRSSYNDPSLHYITLVFTSLFFQYDIAKYNFRQIFIFNFFVFSILHIKIQELMLKIQFILDYLAPWQIPWGSAFHAFAQPFAVPHFAATLAQAVISAIISAPLQPMLGSAFFLMSYVRPMKFWERDYNTKSIDYTKTRLANQLERQRTGIDANRLDSVFYEHLTKCLQRRLYGDLAIGRWGNVSQGDCFVMASDNLNCLVHIIELGNGLCTFQLRGLEFKGTYCQQQEVEAITEGVNSDDGCCCCEPGHLPNMLSVNAAFNQRWLAWSVTQSKYVVEGYSISDNSATQMLQPFDLRRALITYYVKSIIYFTVTSPLLSKWLSNTTIYEALEYTRSNDFVDVDPTFSFLLDMDFDVRSCGVTKARFCILYLDWIQYCVERVKNDKIDRVRASLIADIDTTESSFLVSLCFSLSLLARRSLSAASHNQQFDNCDKICGQQEFLLYGLHALLKGDFRITSLHDEWIFEEMKFFKIVVAPSVRMCLKLHQDHFTSPEEYDDNMSLYEAISGYQKNLFISHESDPAWRSALLSNVPSLLALRHIVDDGSNQFKIIMLNKRYLSFRIIKLNKECVRGLWASQQQELIFLRNTDPERGSIQNAKQVLRNMINSSCDIPI
ncbi:Pecanex-like protein 1, partial [Fragariocoptes setiger]